MAINEDQLGLESGQWQTLVRNVRAGKCTPFLGAGASSSVFGSADEVARVLAADDKDLLAESPDNLPRIAQQLRSRIGTVEPNQRMAEYLKKKAPPDLAPPETPQLALAGLKFPVWVTTAYDDLIERALAMKYKDPEPRLCKWSTFGEYPNSITVQNSNRDKKTISDPFAEFQQAEEATPLVYHLYGHVDWEETLVLSEFDYLEFLATTAQCQDRAGTESDVGRISTRVDAAIRKTSLLFLGYRLGDLDFRILLHSLRHRLAGNPNLSIAVQLQPDDAATKEVQEAVSDPARDSRDEQKERLRDYAERDLKEYFPKATNIKVVFVDCEKFATKLASECEGGKA